MTQPISDIYLYGVEKLNVEWKNDVTNLTGWESCELLIWPIEEPFRAGSKIN